MSTDDLRTRIAAVLYSRAMSRLAWHRAWDDLQPEVQQMWLDDADAVIRELEADYILVPKGHTIARIRSAEKLGLTGDGE